jgi:heptosyltransferase-2
MAYPKTLVIQPRSGIGDMIWHLPHIRALAREVEGGPVYLLTKSKAHAKQWLNNEPSIAHIEYLNRRNMFLTSLRLRKYGFTSAWVLHQSVSYALVPFLAGIPQRIGPGFGRQNSFLTNKPLATDIEKEFHLDQMDALMRSQNLQLRVEDQRILLNKADEAFIENRYGHKSRPWITLGVGASEDFKTWPSAYFIELAKEINKAQSSTFFVCGSPGEFYHRTDHQYFKGARY